MRDLSMLSYPLREPLKILYEKTTPENPDRTTDFIYHFGNWHEYGKAKGFHEYMDFWIGLEIVERIKKGRAIIYKLTLKGWDWLKNNQK